MEALFIYLIKSSGLLAMFYLAYHFLVRKETFFDGNRWFLLSGLLTSALVPLFFIKKIIWVESPKISMEDLVAYTKQASVNTKNVAVVEAFDWMQLLWIGYSLIALSLLLKIILNLFSLYRMLHKQQQFKREGFTLVDSNDNIAPFSFFKYIVYNSDFYTDTELQSIILHEQVHSKERHSVDVLLVKLFTVIFWFNPFIWLYKKAIAQNLEYIADQKAIAQLSDRQAYQHALLKVVTHQNCLSITNHFYQSLIKKRIVMLNTNQSNKRNSWKYALILPVLIGFVFLFQVKVVAQEVESDTWVKNISNNGDIKVKIDKNCSDEQLKKEAKKLKEEHGVTLKFSKVKRNTSGEITGIKVEYKDKNGNKGTTQCNGDEPITPIHFYKSGGSIGFGQPRNMKIYSHTTNGHPSISKAFTYRFDSDSLAEIKDVDVNIDIPENIIALQDTDIDKKIIVKNGKKPLVIVNGKVISDDSEIQKIIEEAGAKGGYSFSYSSSDDKGKTEAFTMSPEDIAKIKNDAMNNLHMEIKKIRPQVKSQIRMVNADWKKVKEELEKSKIETEASKPEMEKAKAEMMKAKEEMIKAKEEMLKAKAEFEKERAKLKKESQK